MIAEREVEVRNTLGLHVRPSTALAKTANGFKCDVRIVKDDQSVNAKSSLELLTLAAVMGTRLHLRADGDDAEAAVDAVAKLIESKFGEE